MVPSLGRLPRSEQAIEESFFLKRSSKDVIQGSIFPTDEMISAAPKEREVIKGLGKIFVKMLQLMSKSIL